MRVLFISGGDYKYGAAKSMMDLLVTLKEDFGIEVILLTKLHNKLNDYCNENGIENYSYWYRDIMSGSPYTNKFYTSLKHIVKYISYLVGGMWQKGVFRLPLDFSSLDIVHTNINRVDIGAYIAKKMGIPHIWHVREMGKEDYNVVFYKKECIEFMNQNACKFIVISEAVKTQWSLKRLDSFKMEVIYNGLDIHQISERRDRKDNIFHIVIVGHVQPNKGQLQVVQAVSSLPEDIRQRIMLDIIGEAYPDYKKKIENFIIKNNLGRQIKLVGYKNNIPEILSQYDIGITSSKAEGFGRCTVEYMASGLVTIASDTGANAELIKDKINGLLYEYENIQSLADKIKWIMENWEESKKIAKMGQKIAFQKYSKYQCAKRVKEVYEKCLKII